MVHTLKNKIIRCLLPYTSLLHNTLHYANIRQIYQKTETKSVDIDLQTEMEHRLSVNRTAKKQRPKINHQQSSNDVAKPTSRSQYLPFQFCLSATAIEQKTVG